MVTKMWLFTLIQQACIENKIEPRFSEEVEVTRNNSAFMVAVLMSGRYDLVESSLGYEKEKAHQRRLEWYAVQRRERKLYR